MKKILALILASSAMLAGCVAGIIDVDAPSRAATLIPKPGGAFKECRNCPEMVVLPAGTFMMGAAPTESHYRDIEKQHRVTIAKPFAISRTEVTWDQWEACVRDGGCDGVGVDKALRLKMDGTANADFVDWGRGTRPVVGVSWYDAQAFVGWLNRKNGHDDLYRLLSAAEWEYAARAGTTTAYPWGDQLDHNYGNFGKEEPGLGPKAEGRDVWLAQTAPVASFPANAFGLHDMHGNAFEWVEDCFLADLANTANDGSAIKDGSCSSREFRSGSYTSNPYMHRSGNRVRGYTPDTRGRNYMTIRVGRTLE
jgi:formylglycine-generating enzyme required for sulfatase activity